MRLLCEASPQGVPRAQCRGCWDAGRCQTSRHQLGTSPPCRPPPRSAQCTARPRPSRSCTAGRDLHHARPPAVHTVHHLSPGIIVASRLHATHIAADTWELGNGKVKERCGAARLTAADRRGSGADWRPAQGKQRKTSTASTWSGWWTCAAQCRAASCFPRPARGTPRRTCRARAETLGGPRTPPVAPDSLLLALPHDAGPRARTERIPTLSCSSSSEWHACRRQPGLGCFLQR